MGNYKRKDDGLYYDAATGRTWEHKGRATRIYWSGDMLSYLRRHFATTLNEELAGCLGVSVRTMIRKAHELGLQKDPVWLHEVWDERRNWARICCAKAENSGRFKRGEHHNLKGEFKKGNRPSEEMKKKRADGLRRWCRRHPDEARARALKAWETRRRNVEGKT